MDIGKKEACKRWGAYMRTEFSGHGRRGVLARVKEEGWGASETRPGYKLPIPHSCPEMPVHRAYINDMNERESIAFWLRFVAKGSPKEKADQMGVSVATFYRVLDIALAKVP